MKKRIALLLLTSLCLMNTMPSFAAQTSKVIAVGSAEVQYTTLPDEETLLKDVGFKPKAPAEVGSDQSVSENSALIQYGEVNLYYSDVQANSISWAEDGILYIIMDINKTVTKEELVAMAREMIDLEKDESL